MQTISFVFYVKGKAIKILTYSNVLSPTYKIPLKSILVTSDYYYFLNLFEHCCEMTATLDSHWLLSLLHFGIFTKYP